MKATGMTIRNSPAPPVRTIDVKLARRILIARQGLLAPPTGRQSADDLMALIDRLGFVQLDSIATVERAHHMTLFARNRSYRAANLARLAEVDRTLFENWTHDAALIPTRFYPFWQRRFQRDAERLKARWGRWQRRKGFHEMLDGIVDHIGEHGPVMARALGQGDKKANAGGWWEWHPSKTALEYLWRTGRLAVTRREGFQKVYDLTERVIPAAHRSTVPDDDQLIDWCCRSALERLGLASAGELAGFWGIISAREARGWAAGAGADLPRVSVEAADGSRPRECLADPSVLDLKADGIALPSALRVVSPFDPVIRDRRRLARLFNFDYRIEVFVPAPQRRYGYYVFPLLEGDRFVGRIDMKRDLRRGTLNVTGLWWEPEVKVVKGRLARLDAELARVARFAGCRDVEFSIAAR